MLGILAFITIALLAWVEFLPSPGRPHILVKLLGYTNDAVGTPLAIIAVTNLDASTIFIYRPRILISAPAERGGVTFSGGLVQWHSTLAGGASANFTIPPPTNQSPWKLSFFVYNDLGRIQVFKRILGGGRHMPYEIDGDWLDDKK